jgi:methylated-DNA-[protein]-cysteine S-methyltransferase
MSKKEKATIYIGQVAPNPLGVIFVAMNERGLIAVSIGGNNITFTQELEKRHNATVIYDEERTAEPRQQIKEYLAGWRQEFDLPIDWSVMTPFQEKVLRVTYAIPRGQTLTYGEIAAQVGSPRGARAVGRAEATNPIPLVVPCHRVIGADGGLHGYGGAGGLETKAWLLELEGGA